MVGNAHASIVTLPTGLSPGDQYRLVFVTDGARTVLSSDIGDYNAFVTAEAVLSSELAALGTTWTVIGSSDAGVDARDNTNTNPTTDGPGVPIYTLTDLIVASGYNDLWDGSIANPINITQTGTVLDDTTGDFIATGSLADGTVSGFGAFPQAYGFGDTFDGNVEIGWATKTDARWVYQDAAADNFRNRRFYAMSDVLTVASVPEPATFALLGLGMAGFAAMRRRRSNA
jgi:hypothetical protein